MLHGNMFYFASDNISNNMTDYYSDTDVKISGTSFASAIQTLATARLFTVSSLSSLTHI